MILYDKKRLAGFLMENYLKFWEQCYLFTWMVSFIMNLISVIYYYVKKRKKEKRSKALISCDKFHHMLMVNGLGAGFGTPCRSFMYHGCCRSSPVKFWGWRACPSNTSAQLKGSGVTMSTTHWAHKEACHGLGPISCLFASVQYIWITPIAV